MKNIIVVFTILTCLSACEVGADVCIKNSSSQNIKLLLDPELSDSSHKIINLRAGDKIKIGENHHIFDSLYMFRFNCLEIISKGNTIKVCGHDSIWHLFRKNRIGGRYSELVIKDDIIQDRITVDNH